MTTPLPRPATVDGLFLWVLHRFTEVFEEHAVLKGGIALRLFDCPRATNDIDYVFVPFRSKNQIATRIDKVLREIEGADVVVAVHSKMVRARLRVDSSVIQIEANVDLECPTMAVPTTAFANAQGQPSRIVRVMSLDCALAHKLAAWNERRLARDLYDAWFLSTRLGAVPDMAVLARRLDQVESRLPRLAKKRRMTRAQLASELHLAAQLDEREIHDELAPILPATEMVGLLPRIRGAVIRLAELLEATDKA